MPGRVNGQYIIDHRSISPNLNQVLKSNTSSPIPTPKKMCTCSLTSHQDRFGATCCAIPFQSAQHAQIPDDKNFLVLDFGEEVRILLVGVVVFFFFEKRQSYWVNLELFDVFRSGEATTSTGNARSAGLWGALILHLLWISVETNGCHRSPKLGHWKWLFWGGPTLGSRVIFLFFIFKF